MTSEELKFHFEAVHFEALARKETALAKKAKKREAKAEAALNGRHYVLNFEQAVRSTKDQRDILDKWHRLDPDADWRIVYNSPGGSVIDGNALLDHLCAHSKRWGGTHHITSVTRGYSASMAAILAQAADYRIIGPLSVLMLHKVATLTGGSLEQIEDEVAFLRMLTEADENFLTQRSEGKLTKATLRRKYARKDWWVSSSEAIKYGLADVVG